MTEQDIPGNPKSAHLKNPAAKRSVESMADKEENYSDKIHQKKSHLIDEAKHFINDRKIAP